MAKNTIIMIGDGMGWEMARAAAIYKQIEEGKTGNTLADFYTSGKGTGLNLQTLTGYALSTNYGTTIANPTTGVFSTGNTATVGPTNAATGVNPDIPGFVFNPTFNPGTTATGGATVSSGAVGNLVGYDPVRGGINPWTPGTDSNYIKYSYPDSANTATTLYSGVKSYNNAIGVNIFEDPVETVLTAAALQNKSTAIVTSVPIDHATPGAAAANVNRRNKYDSNYPNLDSILQQELRIYQPTVILGGGHPLANLGGGKAPLPPGVEPNPFTYITESTYKELSENPNDNIYGYTFLERGPDAAKVLTETVARLDPEEGDRLFGLYGARGQEGNLPLSSANGDYSTTGLANFSVFSSKGLNQDYVRPLKAGETDAQFIATERNQNPTLAQLTKASLDLLGKDPDGFWMMVEGGDIDWAAHDNNIDNLIGTTLDFDKAVGEVLTWIQQNGGWADNQLIITADHDHYLTLNNNFPELVRTLGAEKLTEIDTISGSGQQWGNTADDKYGWGNHANRPVPVYYQGEGSEELAAAIGQGYEAYSQKVAGIAGLIDQVHIADAMFNSVNEVNQGDLVAGTAGSETFIAGVGIKGVRDTIFTGAGNDIIDLAYNQGARQNRVDAGKGADTIYVNRRDRVFGGEGDDIFDAVDGLGMNRMSGGAGNDTFYLGSDDYALGGAGDDIFYCSGSGNTISGGAGVDQFWIVNAALPSDKNTIVDFQIGLDVIGVVAAKSLGISDSTLKLTQNGNDTDIDFNGKTLATLIGIQASSLSTGNTSQFMYS